MSPRAACRLEHFGFDRVFDYVDRIADWKASGFAVEGSAEPELRVADATRPDIPTCRPDEPIDEVRPRVVATGWDACVVIDCDGVVVGRLRPAARENNGRLTAQQEMEPGPTTVRPDGLLQPLVDRMKKRDTPQVLVTTPQGTLIGVLLPDDGERLLAGEPPTQIWRDRDGCPGRWAATS